MIPGTCKYRWSEQCWKQEARQPREPTAKEGVRRGRGGVYLLLCCWSSVLFFSSLSKPSSVYGFKYPPIPLLLFLLFHHSLPIHSTPHWQARNDDTFIHFSLYILKLPVARARILTVCLPQLIALHRKHTTHLTHMHARLTTSI